MFLTWMMAAQMWIESDPKADPFRMAEEEMGKILNFPVPQEHGRPVKDRSLVA